MPHLILEYSDTIEKSLDIPKLLRDLHETLAEAGTDKTRIKTRGIALRHFIVGHNEPGRGDMMHLTLLLLEGRDAETRKNLAAPLHRLMTEFVARIPGCAVTLEVREMVRETYFL